MDKLFISHIIFGLFSASFLVAVLMCVYADNPNLMIGNISWKQIGSLSTGVAVGVAVFSMIRGGGFKSLITNAVIFFILADTSFVILSCIEAFNRPNINHPISVTIVMLLAVTGVNIILIFVTRKIFGFFGKSSEQRKQK